MSEYFKSIHTSLGGLKRCSICRKRIICGVRFTKTTISDGDQSLSWFECEPCQVVHAQMDATYVDLPGVSHEFAVEWAHDVLTGLLHGDKRIATAFLERAGIQASYEEDHV